MREHFTGSYDGVLWYIILKKKFMKIDKNFGIGFSCSFVSAFFWGTSYIGAGYLLNGSYMSPMTLSFCRFLGAGLILLTGCLILYKRQLWDFLPWMMAKMILHGIIGFGGMSCFIFMGQKEANALNSVMIMAMVPALTTVCALFTKFRPNLRQLIAMGISSLGCLLVVGVITPDGVQLNAFGRGEFLVLLAAGCWVFYTFSGRIMVPQVGVMIYTLYGMLGAAAAIWVLLFCGIIEPAVFPSKAVPWLVMGYLILCPTLAAFICWNTVQKYIDLSLQTIMQYLSPVTVMLLAGPILVEKITLLDIIGAVILIGGMCFNVVADKIVRPAGMGAKLGVVEKTAVEIVK